MSSNVTQAELLRSALFGLGASTADSACMGEVDINQGPMYLCSLLERVGVRHFTAARRVADVDGVFKSRGERSACYVVGVMIHVMAVKGWGGTAMSAPVASYDAIAVLEEEEHLGVPIVGSKGPAG